MLILSAVIVFLSVFLSGISMLFVRLGKLPLKLLLAFSGSFLLAVCLLHLIPEVYSEGGMRAGIFMLGGFFVQLLLEFFTEGVEHGHTHVCEHDHPKGLLPYGMIIGVCLHSFLEGLPLAGSEQHGHVHSSQQLLTGIVLHNIPIAVTFMTMLIHLQVKRVTALLLLLLFALMTPLGMLCSVLVGEQFHDRIDLYLNAALAAVVGIFLHISTTILFESSENHRFNLLKFGIISLGAGVAIAVSFI